MNIKNRHITLQKTASWFIIFSIMSILSCETEKLPHTELKASDKAKLNETKKSIIDSNRTWKGKIIKDNFGTFNVLLRLSNDFKTAEVDYKGLCQAEWILTNKDSDRYLFKEIVNGYSCANNCAISITVLKNGNLSYKLEGLCHVFGESYGILTPIEK